MSVITPDVSSRCCSSIEVRDSEDRFCLQQRPSFDVRACNVSGRDLAALRIGLVDFGRRDVA